MVCGMPMRALFCDVSCVPFFASHAYMNIFRTDSQWRKT